MSLITKSALTGPLAKIYFCTVITFCSLYAAQPIQPLFQQEFALTPFQAILFTTLMMLPLGFAPMFYGVLLESFSARIIVRLALLFLGVLELVFCLTSNYLVLLVIRGLQGMAIPAILTSLVSYISFTAPREEVQAAVARYIAATILGGFLGRFLSGLFTDLFGWRFFFFLLGLLLIWAFSCCACSSATPTWSTAGRGPRRWSNWSASRSSSGFTW